jgi:hypothetical protein
MSAVWGMPRDRSLLPMRGKSKMQDFSLFGSKSEGNYLALAAIFLTMASTSLRSLSFRLTE